MMIPLSLLASAALAGGNMKDAGKTPALSAARPAAASTPLAPAAAAIPALPAQAISAPTGPVGTSQVQRLQAQPAIEGDAPAVAETAQAQAGQRFDKTAKTDGGEPVLGPMASLLRTTAAGPSSRLAGRFAVAALTALGRAVSIESLTQAAAAGNAGALKGLDAIAEDRVSYAGRNRRDGEKSEVWERKTAEAVLALKNLRALSETAAEPVKTKAGELFEKHAQVLAKTFEDNTRDRYYAGSASGSRAMSALVAVKAPQAVALLEPRGRHPARDSYSYRHFDPDYYPSVDDYQARKYLEEIGTPDARAALERIEAQRVADQEAYRQRALRDHEYGGGSSRRASARRPSDFQIATDVTQPFWEREAALGRMHPKDAAFWSRDVTLPRWTQERFQGRGRRR